jgi:hypothetical protein
MKQITEDYVSFEIAKLLKEKGFDIPCRQAYFNGSLVDYTMYGFCDGELLDCPSQSLALKWLREVHNQIIIIKYGNVGFVEESILQWWWELLNTKGELHACNIVDGNKSYEEACEDSILYVLKNLI